MNLRKEVVFMKPFIYMEEALEKQAKKGGAVRLLGEDNGCMAGCCSGISVYSSTEYGFAGAHEDQEGFFVLSGEGYAKLDDLEFEVFPGTSFVALPGVKHTVKAKNSDEPVRVFWFHSAL